MKKQFLLFFSLLLCTSSVLGQLSDGKQPEFSGRAKELIVSEEGTKLSNFVTSPYYNEQVLSYTYNPDVKVQVNAPPASEFDPTKPTAIVMYGLPNGNTTDWTIGKQAATGDDWHYQIQHIGAQTRFLRKQNLDFNLVTVYMEASQLSWSTWRNANTNGNTIIKEVTEEVMSLFSDYNPYIVLSGHSGGGNFPFGFMDAVTEIPSYVKRISFLDSNYNWDNTAYGAKLKKWLEASPDNHLSVIAYNDSIALLNGQPIVSATGGTWYRSRTMHKYLKENLPSLNWQASEDAEFVTYSADNNRIQFLLKQNPTKVIYHTVLVEKNGYIQSLLSGTSKEGQGYTFWGNHVYDNLIQSPTVYPHILRIPPRKSNAINGAAFMEKIKNLSLEDREFEIYREISNGNIPNSFRQPTRITDILLDGAGATHSVDYEVLPDFLAVGSDEDFCRIPMLPATAQRIATLFGATLPTSKLSDMIHQKALVKMSPKTMTPDNTMTTVPVFATHNQEIENTRIPLGESLESLIVGHKKDIIIHSRLVSNPTSVIIYGWHYTSGTPIQPVYSGHSNQYVDYSHGVRIINQEVLVDGANSQIKDLLRDQAKHKLFSDEASPLTRTEYTTGATINPPSTITTFAIEAESATSARIIFNAQSNLTYKVLYGTEVANLNQSLDLDTDNSVVEGLSTGQIYYFAMQAANIAGPSALSEKLAICLSDKRVQVLIVNGFDRPMAGNTYDFVKEHGIAIKANGYAFASATNEAVSEGLVDLKDYALVNYILGEESTQNKTFDATEQSIVKKYLQNGGHLLVTAAEIGWDLGRATSGAASNSFLKDYLKCTYVSDNPDGGVGYYHDVRFILNSEVGKDEYSFSFGNGPSGTSVQYPDVLKPEGGAEGFLQFVKGNVGYDTSKGFAGVSYSGMFDGGSKKGKVITMSIPFESINPETDRIEVMKRLLKYLDFGDDVSVFELESEGYSLGQNIPNPAKDITYISYSLPEATNVELNVWSLSGQKIVTLVKEEQTEGSYTVPFDVSSIETGIYFYQLITKRQVLSKKMIISAH